MSVYCHLREWTDEGGTTLNIHGDITGQTVRLWVYDEQGLDVCVFLPMADVVELRDALTGCIDHAAGRTRWFDLREGT